MSQEIVLLVIGNWGSGKSATANTLLGYDAFSKNNSTTGTVTQAAVKTSADKTLTIVDGLCLWGKDPEKLDEDTLFDAHSAVAKCGSGFNAILMIMKYGEVYSEEEARVVAVAKRVFGKKIFEEYGVCVFTRGDDFKYAVEEGEEQCKTFQQWCNSQTGRLKYILGDCGRRCVLIDNRQKDPREKNDLLRIVTHLSKNGTRRFTLREYQKFHGRDFAASGSTIIEKGFRNKLENIRKEFSGNPTRTALQAMLNDLRDLSEEISQSQIEQKQIQNFISEAQKLTTDIKLQLNKRSSDGDKEKLNTMSGVSENEYLNKDRAMPGNYDKQSLPKYRNMPEAYDGPSLVQESDSNTFYKDYSYKGTDARVQDKAAEAERLIEDFKRYSLLSNDTERKMHFDTMKSKVIELVKSTSYLDHFKSKIAKLELEIQNKLGLDLESSVIGEVNTDAMEISPCLEETTATLKDKAKTSEDVKLLLLGRSGHGKSSTGNSLLGKPAFPISSSTAATKSNMVAMESQSFQHFAVSVVDGPSLDDTVLSSSTDLDKMLKSMRETLELCDYGFSGLLVILKFGQRFTKQEKDAVGLIKSIMGKDVLKKYGICVMTHGDNYEYEMEEESLEFLDWCQAQTGEIAELFKECLYRCVLIDNKTRDEQTQMKQRNKVLGYVNRTEKYSEEEFLEAEKDFQELSIQCAMTQVEQANSVIMSKVREKLQQIERDFPNDEGRYRSELETLQQGLQARRCNIESLGQNATTEYLMQLVRTLQMQINSKLRLCQQSEELKQLEKEKERVQENVSSPLSPIRMGHLERQRYSPFLRGQTRMEAPDASLAADTAMQSSNNTRQIVIELNDFIEKTLTRWGEANRLEISLRLYQKKVILKDIDWRLQEAERRGYRVEALDRAYAELIQIKETITHEMSGERGALQPPSSYQHTISTGPAEFGFEMVYPHAESKIETISMYPYSTNAYPKHTSTSGFIQQPNATQCYQHKSSRVKKIKKRWIKIESFLKHLATTFNNFVFY